MTGPGPQTPPPPPRPGRLSDYLRQIAAARARTGAVAATAGSRGHSAEPLTAEQRADRYRRQTGTDRLTPRQRRRIRHKNPEERAA